MTKDMTQGNPMKLIVGFALPLLFGFLFQQFYNLVDTVIVGRFLGVNELAGVGATGSVNFLVIGFCMGVCNGFSIPVAHKFGAGDYKGMRKYVANSAWLGIAFSVVLTTVTVVFCRPILELMKTPEDIIDFSYDYIVIIFAAIPFTFLYNIVSGVIRALGDSKTPVIFLVISSIVNIGLDLFFIITFKMGVAGAAWATAIAQAVAGIGCTWYMVKKFEILHIQKDEWAFNAHMMGSLCAMGVPMGLQYSITAIGSVILQTATNTLGSSAVAAVTAAGKVCNFLACPYDAMGSTMATYGGQNVGAGKLERLDKGLWLLRDTRSSVCGYCGAYSCIRRRSFGKAVCRWRRTGDYKSGKAVPYMEHGILLPACACQYSKIPDSGYGICFICHTCRCVRDDSKVAGGIGSCSGDRLYRCMSWKSDSMDICGCVFDSGLFPC